MKLGEAIYKEQQAKSGKAGAKPEGQKTSGNDKKDDVVDAEYEEVKDDKKIALKLLNVEDQKWLKPIIMKL